MQYHVQGQRPESLEVNLHYARRRSVACRTRQTRIFALLCRRLMSIEDARRVTQISSYARHTFHLHKCKIFAYLNINSPTVQKSVTDRTRDESYILTHTSAKSILQFYIIQIKLIFIFCPYQLDDFYTANPLDC